MKRWARVRAWLRGDKPTERRPAQPSVPLVPLPGRGDPVCRNCLHFRSDVAASRPAVPGLASLEAAHASARADDGLCLKHDRFVTQGSNCRFFRARLVRSVAPGRSR